MRNPKKARRVRPDDLDDGEAFVRDYRRGFAMVPDCDAEALGEEFVAAATSNDAVAETARNELTSDELGGAIEEPDDIDL